MRDKKAKTLINKQLVQEMTDMRAARQPVRQSNSVFGIICSATPEVRNLKLYGTKELARAKLKELADERRHKLGVHWHEETEDMFFYTLGWEEHPVRFSIIEIHVEG
jgi:hypothetical protein